MSAVRKIRLSTVEEFRRDLHIAHVVLMNAGTKLGAIVNFFGPRDHALHAEAICELEEAAREYTYREQLLLWALREQVVGFDPAFGPRSLVVIDGGVS